MPSRKQRRRLQKERRHEYETVWVDSEGNELEEPPEGAGAPSREKRPAAKSASQTGSRRPATRSARVPQAPSWNRSIRRSLIWVGVLVALLLFLQSRAKHPNYTAAVVFGALYLLLFPVFTYYFDRMMYRRYEKQQASKKS